MEVRAGFSCTCLSRPGYLKTPPSAGESFGEQADAVAVLLDHPGITTVGVIGVSTCGAPAMSSQFAIPGERPPGSSSTAYPELTRCLERGEFSQELILVQELADLAALNPSLVEPA